MAGPSDDLVGAARASAARLGIDPSDLLTAISYETGGKMSPSIYGGKGGQYLGLIQFSPENQKKYGVTDKQTAAEQMGAVEAYLRDRGLKPGSGLLDTYSTINAGRPGLYNRSDAANGGVPGTVADKVATMAGHRMRANALLGVEGDQGAAPAPQPTAGSPASAAPLSLSPSGGGATSDDATAQLLASLTAIPTASQQDQQPIAPVAPVATPKLSMLATPELAPIKMPALQPVELPNLARVRALSQAMSRVR